MWTIDYTMSLAIYNYTAAYLHTREPGVTYNIFTPNTTSNGDWTIGPPYYSLLFLSEALRSVDGDGSVIVSDLGLTNRIDNSYIAGYVVYDGSGREPQRLVLMNFGDWSSLTSGMPTVSFNIPSGLAKEFNNGTVSTKYLVAPSVSEQQKITWAGQGVDGQGMLSTGSSEPQQTFLSCSGGCNVDVPGPGIVLVDLNTTSVIKKKSTIANSSTRCQKFVSPVIWFSWLGVLAFALTPSSFGSSFF